MIYNYTDHMEIPSTISSYLMTVADIDNIAQISLEEINSFLNDMEAQADYIEASKDW